MINTTKKQFEEYEKTANSTYKSYVEYVICLLFGLGCKADFDKAREFIINNPYHGYYGSDWYDFIFTAIKYEEFNFPESFIKRHFDYYDSGKDLGPEEYARAAADCFYFGIGTRKNFRAALKWYSYAAKCGDAYSQFRLGVIYKYGDGVFKNIKQGLYFYQKSADQGFVLALCKLGDCYYYGEGVKQDYYTAFNYHKTAVDKDYDVAQYYLGYAYENGEGVSKDLSKAYMWYKKAASQGNKPAIETLAKYYKDYK